MDFNVLSGFGKQEIYLSGDTSYFQINNKGELSLNISTIAAILKAELLPAGTILPVMFTTIPTGAKLLLLHGQEIPIIGLYSTLFANTYCGDVNNPTAPAFYCTNGAGVRTLPSSGGTHFVLPDARGLPLAMIGNAIISGRTKTGPAAIG